MINNRQAGRRRGRGGQQQRSQGNPGRPDNGNRIDNRARGNAAQLLEKYKSLARDAQMQGDRVNTEYYLQFADHYFRVLAETRSRFEENRQPQPGGANSFQDDEQDYDEDGEPVARQDRQPQRQAQSQGEAGDGDGDRGNDRDNRPRRFNGNNGGNNGYEQQGERQPRGPRPERGYNGRSEGEPSPQQAERVEREGPAGVEGEVIEQPRRRGRPRREDREAPASFDAGILPPAIGPSSASNDDAAPADEEKPRRRRTRVAVETPAAE